MDIDIWEPLAGLMLFLLALSLIEQAVQSLSGHRFRAFLANNTTPPLRGVVSGTVTTAVLQSSSLVSLMMLAFVGAGVIQLKNALSIVFGANLGTTATGWIVATIGFKLDLEALALPLIAAGGFVWAVVHKKRLRSFGQLVLGLGLLLLALQFMKSSVDNASAYAAPELMATFTSLEFLLFGALFSAVIQSSSATMVIALSALNAGIIDLEAAAVLVIGANLGTTSTVILGAIGGTPNKKRIAAGHFLFNVITDIIAFLMRGPILAALAWLEDPLMTLVAFHTSFNLLGIALFLPVIGRFSRFLEMRFQQPEQRVGRYLEDSVVAIPEAAIHNLEREVGYLLDRVIAQNGVGLGIQEEHKVDVGNDFAEAYQATKTLEGEILTFSYGLDRSQLLPAHSKRVEELLQATRDAVLASKACKDILSDLEVLRRSAPGVTGLLLEAQEQFYERVADLVAQETIPVANVEELVLAVAVDHREVHERIHRDITAGGLSGAMVSQVLNVNRLLYNSQQYLLSAICQWVGIEVLSETPLALAS